MGLADVPAHPTYGREPEPYVGMIPKRVAVIMLLEAVPPSGSSLRPMRVDLGRQDLTIGSSIVFRQIEYQRYLGDCHDRYRGLSPLDEGQNREGGDYFLRSATSTTAMRRA